jgi:calcineurin-like phosphoesterase family protein
MVYFTADQHLGHTNIIKYCNRPFASIQEMDKIILDNTFDVLRPGDTLISLGDLSFKEDIARKYLNLIKKTNVSFMYISGNHDRQILSFLRRNGVGVHELKTICITEDNIINSKHGLVIVLCHYSLRVWDRSHFNSWQLYGHSHGTLPPIGKQEDVGVDAQSFELVSMDYLRLKMIDKPNNFNFIKEAR